nr:uncharacterized protein LOC129385065 [Dermacentor andersoni]
MSLSMGDDEAGLCAELERRPCSRTARKRFTGGGPAWQPEEPHAAPPPSLVAGPPSALRCLEPAPRLHAATCPGSLTPGHSPPAAGGLASRRRAVTRLRLGSGTLSLRGLGSRSAPLAEHAGSTSKLDLQASDVLADCLADGLQSLHRDVAAVQRRVGERTAAATPRYA